MMKHLFVVAFAFVLVPITASAAISYERSPSGASPVQPLSVTVSSENIGSENFFAQGSYWHIRAAEYSAGILATSACFPKATNSGLLDLSGLAVGTQVDYVFIRSYYQSDCTDAFDTVYVEGDGTDVTIFTVSEYIPPVVPPSLTDYIASSSALMTTSYDFDMGDLVSFMASLALQYIGSGLGVLYLLMPYMIGVFVIGGIIFFIYRFWVIRHW